MNRKLTVDATINEAHNFQCSKCKNLHWISDLSEWKISICPICYTERETILAFRLLMSFAFWAYRGYTLRPDGWCLITKSGKYIPKFCINDGLLMMTQEEVPF